MSYRAELLGIMECIGYQLWHSGKRGKESEKFRSDKAWKGKKRERPSEARAKECRLWNELNVDSHSMCPIGNARILHVTKIQQNVTRSFCRISLFASQMGVQRKVCSPHFYIRVGIPFFLSRLSHSLCLWPRRRSFPPDRRSNTDRKSHELMISVITDFNMPTKSEIAAKWTLS